MDTGQTLHITSPGFKNLGMIPGEYTCDGKNINPELVIENIPVETKSLALIVDDPDAPGGMFVHWVVWNIPVAQKIAAHSVPGTEGINDFRHHAYGGPCPPSGTHRYFFKIYALNTKLDLPAASNKKQLEAAMQNNILGYGELVGLYCRIRKP